MPESVAPQSLGAVETCVPVSTAELERRTRRKAVRAHLGRLGMTIGAWARANGYKPKQVYRVLAGENKGLYGDAHDIAVKLGIKDGEVGANRA